MKRKIKLETLLAAITGGILLLFLGCVFWANFHSEQWYNFDIYADAMVAKYMAEGKTLFPEGWTFGNQFYVVATPVLAALFYGIYPNTTVAMGAASCVMTVLVLLSFWWCISPFCKKKNGIAPLCCLIGGTTFTIHATMNSFGLQCFYTMASYYACYVIGICFTLGIWLRLLMGRKQSLWLIGGCAVLNIALGMQSLRELLVLNLPLCVLSLAVSFWNRTGWRNRPNAFAAGMTMANGFGLALMWLLKRLLHIKQVEILNAATGGIKERLVHNLSALWRYMGFSQPDGTFYGWFRLIGPLLVVLLVVCCLIHAVKNRSKEPLAGVMAFCVISLAAVVCAGVLVLHTRGNYYFVWHILVAACVAYAMETWHIGIKNVVLAGLALISLGNFVFQFNPVRIFFNVNESYHQEIVDTLRKEGITRIYYDELTAFEAPAIGAYSEDSVLCVGVRLCTWDTQADNLLAPIPYLQEKSWYKADNTAYLLLTKDRLEILEQESNQAFSQNLMSHLTLKHRFQDHKRDYYLYAMDEALLEDIAK